MSKGPPDEPSKDPRARPIAVALVSVDIVGAYPGTFDLQRSLRRGDGTRRPGRSGV
jgi:hypothetical protein